MSLLKKYHHRVDDKKQKQCFKFQNLLMIMNNEKLKKFLIKKTIKKMFDIKLNEQIEIRNIINDF